METLSALYIQKGKLLASQGMGNNFSKSLEKQINKTQQKINNLL